LDIASNTQWRENTGRSDSFPSTQDDQEKIRSTKVHEKTRILLEGTVFRHIFVSSPALALARSAGASVVWLRGKLIANNVCSSIDR
jgi:hypothetical protein